MPTNPLVSQAWRFATTGAAATGVHVLIAFACIRFVELPPALSNAVASIIATIFSYVAHTLWSFSEALQMRNLTRFIAVSAAASALAAAIAALAEACGLSYWIGIAWVVCIVPAASFSVHHLWTYRA